MSNQDRSGRALLLLVTVLGWLGLVLQLVVSARLASRAGSLTARYLYPFVDLGVLGLATLLRNAALLALLFWILGLAAVGIDRALGRTQRAP